MVDPNESAWFEFFREALGGGATPGEARKFADESLAVYLERWPREREVVTIEHHREAVHRARWAVVNEIARAVLDAGMSAANQLVREERRDAANVIRTLCCEDFARRVTQVDEQGRLRACFDALRSWSPPSKVRP